MRYAIAGRSSIAGTTVRAQFSLYSIAAVRPRVREIGIFNTTSTAFNGAVTRFTNATGVGAGLTEVKYDPDTVSPSCTGFAGHTSDSAVSDVFRACSLGAAIGAGVIWTFGDTGIIIPVGTANGLGIAIPNGSGQITDYHLDWDE